MSLKNNRPTDATTAREENTRPAPAGKNAKAEPGGKLGRADPYPTLPRRSLVRDLRPGERID